jgi:hypothetical protein
MRFCSPRLIDSSENRPRSKCKRGRSPLGRGKSPGGMCDAAFAKDFRQISFDIRLKSVPAPRSRSTSQLLSRWSARNLRIKGRVWPQTTATFEDAGTVEARRFCGMLCEGFARLPQGCDTGLKCGAAHLNRREPASPLARRDRGKACFPAWRAFSAQLRPIDGWSSKTPSEFALPGATNHRNRSNDIVPWGKSVRCSTARRARRAHNR